MNTLVKALIALVPVCALVVWSVIRFSRARTGSSFLQVLGSGCLVVVVLTHICEALHLFPWMRWGDPHSIGHYLDLSSAVLGVAFVSTGYVFHRLRNRF
jgi:formate hydrogenlyase subunit 3/multisubunit Na+/H+ antiporter MnhD subunit